MTWERRPWHRVSGPPPSITRFSPQTQEATLITNNSNYAETEVEPGLAIGYNDASRQQDCGPLPALTTSTLLGAEHVMAKANNSTRCAQHEDIIGRKFGRWTVLRRSDRINSQGYRAYLWCRCECGVTREVQRCGIVAGASKSCGCLHKEAVSGPRPGRTMKPCRNCGQPFYDPPSNAKAFCSAACRRTAQYGAAVERAPMLRLRSIWRGMKNRCRPGAQAAAYYHDRGIRVCPEWEQSYEAFRDWAVANGYAPDMEIDRIDNDRGYSPGNCRWAGRQQQMCNTRKRKNAATSRYKGVSWHRPSRRWRAQIVCDGVHYSLGLYVREEDAAAAYDAKAKELFGEFANPNNKGA